MKPDSSQLSRVEVDRRITDLRSKMDGLDAELVRLLNERAAYASQIGRLKNLVGLEIYQPDREVEVLTNAKLHNQGPLPDDGVARLFERIIDETRRLERSHG